MSVTRTFTVTVVSTGGGNKYFIDGVQQPTLELVEDDEHILISQNTSMFGSGGPGDGLINWEPFIVEFGGDITPGEFEVKLNSSLNHADKIIQ